MAIHRSLRRGLYFTLPFAFAIGCGGVTDIDFQGDSTDGGGATGGSGGDGGGVIVGGSGGSVDGGSGGLPTGGTGAGGAPAGGTGGGTGGAGLTCGGVQCETPTAPIQVDSCCAGDNGEKCGISSDLIGGQCIALGQEGTIDDTCPDQNIQGLPLQGCCKPTGNCGVFDSFLGLGCVDPSEFGLGQPGQKCGTVVDAGTGGVGGGPADAGTGGAPSDAGTPGATNCGITNPTVCTPSQNCCVLDPGLDYCSAKATPCACTQPNCDILPVACDGPEDCATGVCCGTFSFQQNAYTDISCQASCTGQNEREICHPNTQTCSNPNESCSASQFLPNNIWRCN